LGIVPGEQQEEPVLKQQTDAPGRDFTEDTSGMARSPLIQVPLLFPQFEKQFTVPACSQKYECLWQGELAGWDIGQEKCPRCQF
jgi:hypothetical protein